MNVTLEAAELAVLLTLLDAQGVPGAQLDDGLLADPAARQELLNEGNAALQRHGHYTVVDGRFHDLATPLLLAVAVLAAPEQVVLTTRYLGDGAQLMGHYVAQDLVVEFYRTAEGRYRLVALDGVDTACARIEATLGLAAAPAATPLALALPRASLERLLALGLAGAQDELSALLTELGVDAAQARQLAQALAGSRVLADIHLAQMQNGDLQVRHTLTLLAGDGAVGLLQFNPSGSSFLTLPAIPAWQTALRAAMQTLREAEA